VILEYKAPLAEIIVDFYDKLKSVSSGYASQNYEFIGYRPGDLVKLDCFVAGDKVEEFSRIVPRQRMMTEAKNLVKKLKELIPRQMFEVTLQAAVGGKILAREDISAMKKDVTAKLYGGDVTRKNKLLKKQAKGKKKMKQLGKVQIPDDVFLKMLER
jgi:GTP-binding protein LepA